MADDKQNDNEEQKQNTNTDEHEQREHRDWLDVHLELKRRSQRNRRHFLRLRARGQQ